jgi:hypothetical protein
MSGGSFNYAYFKLDGNGSDVAQSLPDLKDIEQYLRNAGKHEAANEVLRGILRIETAIHRLQVVGSHLAPLAKAAEWWVSGDTDEGDFDKVFNTVYLGEKNTGS